jgi:hypothetical protein
MELKPMYRRVIGLDIHQARISACAVSEQSDAEVVVEMREFGGFKRDRRALAQWAKSFEPEVVVMQSTGIYWKSPYAALQSVGIAAWVVNARHVKNLPGRKTDVADAQWLATLARAGLPDTVFMTARASKGQLGAFDVVVAMYHDQGLIPVKYLGVETGVNVTLGLPLVRTSPDHGTAFDIAGTGQADASSLIQAIHMARQLSSSAGEPALPYRPRQPCLSDCHSQFG